MAKQPAFQFYTGDWMKDPNLSMCSPATRGIWMDLLCAMHENNRSGVIAGAADQLSRLCRCSAVDFVSAITELSSTNTADVTDRHGKVTVICRRMKREAELRGGARVRQKRKRDESVKDDGCHADVTQMSRSHSSTSSSTSTSVKPPGPLGENSRQDFEAEPKPENPSLSSNFEQEAFRLTGGPVGGMLLDLVKVFGESEVIDAMYAAEASQPGRKIHAAYVRSILQRWRRDGKPEGASHVGQRAGGNHGGTQGEEKVVRPKDVLIHY